MRRRSRDLSRESADLRWEPELWDLFGAGGRRKAWAVNGRPSTGIATAGNAMAVVPGRPGGSVDPPDGSLVEYDNSLPSVIAIVST